MNVEVVQKKLVGTVTATPAKQRVRHAALSRRSIRGASSESDGPDAPIRNGLRRHATGCCKRSRGKAAGVDGETARAFQQKRRYKLEKLRLELKRGTYRPQPLTASDDSQGQRQNAPGLGIPCLRDKIVQEAIRMALEPIYEAEFHDNSYGFRPNRSTRHATRSVRCRQMLAGFTWVIEGDVKACFDEISHKAILGCLREKVMDNKFLESHTACF